MNKIHNLFSKKNFLILKTEFSMKKIQPRLRAVLSTKLLLNQAKSELVALSNRTKFPQTSLQIFRQIQRLSTEKR
jgi:hypothetical protein